MHDRWTALIALVLAGVGLVVWPAEAADVTASTWWEDMAAMEKDLQGAKWRKVAKAAPKRGWEITRESWFHPDLRRVFAEVALLEAIALANLDRDHEAVWQWHIAQNLHRPIRDRDLTPYGRAAKLLYEHPLRARGEVPFRWRAIPRGPLRGTSFTPPQLAKKNEKMLVLESAAVVSESSAKRPIKIELIVDKDGVQHQPIVTFPPDVHPAITWAVLRSLPHRAMLPARLDGNEVPYLTSIEHRFQVIRGSSRGPDFDQASVTPSSRPASGDAGL